MALRIRNASAALSGVSRSCFAVFEIGGWGLVVEVLGFRFRVGFRILNFGF